MIRRALLVSIGAFWLVVASAFAQERERLPERAYVPIHLEREVRDAASDVVRARYRLEEQRIAGSPEVAARAFLQRNAEDFGMSDVSAELRLLRSRETPVSRHVTFEQVINGVPVHGRTVHVNLDSDGRPTMVISGYEPSLKSYRPPSPTISPEGALATAASRSGHQLTLVTEPRLVVVPRESPATAYHMVVRPEGDFAEWSILIDVQTGNVIEWISTSPHAHATKRSLTSHASHTFSSTTTAADPQPEAVVNGIGYVFDPDPLTTAGVEYGPPYVNANDADIPELNDQRKQRTLREITLFTDGRYRLQGPYVTIVGSDVIGSTYSPPSPTVPEFLYTRANDYFEAVNAYYHIDKSQRYTQTLDIDVHRFPVRVNPHGLGSLDDSQYLPASNAILFGTGGIDDAEDAEVVWHEYAHALLEAAAPGLLLSMEGRALHEGWADYWAVSYTRDLIERGEVPPRDWRKFAPWDGNNVSGWGGRVLDHPGVYPADAPCARGGACNIYQDGLLWATTLMEIWTELGRESIDQLNLHSHNYLSAPVTMRDAAEAIVQADHDLNNGSNISVLLEVFSRRGFVDPIAFAPVITHTPPPSTEDVTSSLPILVHVETLGADVETARVIYSLGDGDDEIRELVDSGSGRFEGEIPLDGIATIIRYHIEVIDEQGRRVVYPANAPTDRIEIEVGPDEDPPTIRHDAPAVVNILDWPTRITAEITDRMGIAEARVEYVIEGQEGSFDLHPEGGDVFAGRFPLIDVQPGTSVDYRIVAIDSAIARNETRSPHDGWYTFVVIDGNVLRAFDFDGATDQGIIATGAWQRGEPTYGVHFAHEGDRVWATRPDDQYPATTGLSRLSLPPIDLSAVDNAYLVFWHWFDSEHDGRAIGPRPLEEAQLWDGGNIKISTDGGNTWRLLVPEDGYNARIAGGFGNPLAGEPGFGGHSKGWRQVVAPLPSENDVRVRFEFGTDEGNVEESIGYAGWYIDDVSIRVERPEDNVPPEILETPPMTQRMGHTATSPRLEVRASDDVGIESVRIPYEVRMAGGGLVEADTAFLAMSPHDRTHYSGRIRPQTDLEAGWSIRYSIGVRDFGGNVVQAESVHRIDIVHEELRTVVHGAQPTGSWRRHANQWQALAQAPSTQTSSLLAQPMDIPTNVETLELVLRHQHRFSSAMGGNLKISDDDGRSWKVITPSDGYDGSIGLGPLAGEPGFRGESDTMRESVFELRDFEGRQVRLRWDFGTAEAAGMEPAWIIESAMLRVVNDDSSIDTPRRYTLHTPYPNPVHGPVTFGYSLDEQRTVLLEVVDMLGRRIDVLVWAVQPAGVYTINYDASHLASGTYLLSMKSEGGRLNTTFVKVR